MVGEVTGSNLYGYVGGNPILSTDPNGDFGIVGFGIGAIGGGIAGYIAGSAGKGGLIGGLEGALIGAVVGGGIGIVAPEFSVEAATYVAEATGSAGLGVLTGTAVFSGFNAVGGALGAVLTNLVQGNPWNSELGTGAAIGALAPILSGEATIVGAGLIGAEDLGVYLLSVNSSIFGIIGAIIETHSHADSLGNSSCKAGAAVP
jgi:hypothetical protein